MSDTPAEFTPRRKLWLRKTLRYSQQEAVASATMTATADNYFNAFAIFLQATALQIGFLTAIPQVFSALSQFISIWLCQFFSRRFLVVVCATVQASIVAALAALSLYGGPDSVTWLIVLVCVYFVCSNLIQPQWRAWMGSVVPPRRRGAFFASRTRLTQIASLCVYMSGGLVLSRMETLQLLTGGFAIVFGVASVGRFISAWLLWRMHDPDPHIVSRKGLLDSLRQFRHSLKDDTFRHYSIFFAGMTGVASLSAPFFAVYMLRELHFTYIEFTLNHLASIATQFVTLHWWGRASDRLGNRFVMLFCACIIPSLPVLWTFSPDFYYLLCVQVISGIAWSGFSLSAANYLYDIRPQKADFAVYAAVQSALSAVLVFFCAILGGVIASHAPALVETVDWLDILGNPLFLVFLSSAALRILVVVWFFPKAKEPQGRKRPKFLQLVLRVGRFNPISGVSLDWLTVVRKKGDQDG